ncbi:histidine phosphatase family protein [Vibrio fluvialis]|nr:histidine phosphatase family protein [Vibrio fluvialis]EKO3552204.1 histidine phosphatase family protein [Vibrio fluvialis]ELI1810097.1 histidine phosphatase family protein [Vibrio fluvialis]ELW1731812.1 histidine phosphatase family protein [Vibrio fluvialis]
MNRVFLLRHAKTLGPPALNGSTDVAVADAVQNELALLLSKHGFTHIITSPLRRCADLAYKLKALNPSITLSVEADFQEMHFGKYDGQTFDDLSAHWSELEAFWQSPADNPLPGAETLQACHQRVSTAWQRWLPTLQDNTLVIAHGGTIRLLLAHVLQTDWRNPVWYSSLAIGNQTLTQLDVFSIQPPMVTVRNIGIELKDKPLN